MENQAEYRAPWANGIVYMCEKHMEQLIKIGNAMGFPVGAEKCGDGTICKNCVVEAEKLKNEVKKG